jgi:hypothetical protein
MITSVGCVLDIRPARVVASLPDGGVDYLPRVLALLLCNVSDEKSATNPLLAGRGVEPHVQERAAAAAQGKACTS